MGIYGDHLAAAVAQQLQAERAAAGLTYQDITDRTGIDRQSVMRYFRDQRPLSTERLGMIADALGVAPAVIIRRAVERIPQ